jgi:hypothetical protein
MESDATKELVKSRRRQFQLCNNGPPTADSENNPGNIVTTNTSNCWSLCSSTSTATFNNAPTHPFRRLLHKNYKLQHSLDA